ncbi:MAG TPA: von Willebrand factor type A domain-containing protein [Candidatus Krumholzibacteria bacterium]|nr:von Willebrand factor type A domain-containing protein [Candidatus Krumholzibacteria bacterium]
MKVITWLAILLISTSFAALTSASETGRITGRVVDAATLQPVAGAAVTVEGTRLTTRTGPDGTFAFESVPAGTHTLRVDAKGVTTAKQRVTVIIGRTARANFEMIRLHEQQPAEQTAPPARLEVGQGRADLQKDAKELPQRTSKLETRTFPQLSVPQAPAEADACFLPRTWPSEGFESYDKIDENGWTDTRNRPLSTFSVDVDAASYSNVRRFLTQGQLPPVDAVRIEELVNYFDYDYPNPRGRDPFSIVTEVAEAPWNPSHKLVHIGLQGRRIDVEDLPPSNLVFLIDVSGSMNQPNKLPLVKASFRMLVDQLRHEDRVAIVVYAGSAGLVLPSTRGSDRETILCAIDRLEAGGSTAGGAGLRLAYRVAQENFLEEGNNRVILATDGDFNVGVSSDSEMIRLIEEKRRSDVFLTVLGVGEGNLKDSKMEKIADHGNGHYAYLDDIVEAEKVLVSEMGASLLTIAKDVKLQVEFNPARVASYRLIGYENRLLRDRDFDDDTKDAGEIGAGHSVTALYEIELADRGRYKPFKYSDLTVKENARKSADLLTVSFRYKEPTASESRLLAVVVKDRNVRFSQASTDFRFSAAVAQFGMILRDSPERGRATMRDVIATASRARGEDEHGYRAEFIRLAEQAEMLLTPVIGER